MNPALVISILLAAVIGQSVGIPCSTSVQYHMELDCKWTSQTHPVDYPSGAHFSPLCGTVHNNGYTLWRLGTTATPGVKDVAEFGSCTKLKKEIAACAKAGHCASGGYVKWMCQPNGGVTVCKFSGMITTSKAHSRVSVMTMLAPSPDWNVGLDSVELCTTDNNGNTMWLNQYPSTGYVDLLPFDAGTDAGTTFTSPNAPVSPFQPMTLFEAMDSSNIFYNPGMNKLYPICKAKLVLVT